MRRRVLSKSACTTEQATATQRAMEMHGCVLGSTIKNTNQSGLQPPTRRCCPGNQKPSPRLDKRPLAPYGGSLCNLEKRQGPPPGYQNHSFG